MRRHRPMTRLLLAVLLLCAAGLAALAVILARPRWRWDWPDDEPGGGW